MKVYEMIDSLKHIPSETMANTCDQLIAGNPEKQVHKIAIGFMLTIALLRQASAWGADMIIVHEPVFYGSDWLSPDDSNIVSMKKLKMINDSGIAVFRYHDHAHLARPDFIHEGFMRSLGVAWKKTEYPRFCLGVCRYDLEEKITPREIAVLTEKNLGLIHPRIIGSVDTPVSKITLGLGSTDIGYSLLRDTDTQLFIGGEMSELMCGEYARDAAELGYNKSLLVLGHYGSEHCGMIYLAEYIGQNYKETEVTYIDSTQGYTFPD